MTKNAIGMMISLEDCLTVNRRPVNVLLVIVSLEEDTTRTPGLRMP
jgi:hypothetical protein